MINGGFGMTMDLERGTLRQWVMKRDDVKRWADTNEPVEQQPCLNEHDINGFEDVLVDVPTGAVAITIFGKSTTNGMWFPLYIKEIATVDGFERNQFMLRFTGQILQSSDEL